MADPLCRNQTNLAIKGIIGLKAMSKIAQMTKHEDPWNKHAVEYLERWKDFAINKEAKPPHTTLSYGDKNSHGNYLFLSFFLPVPPTPYVNSHLQAFSTTSMPTSYSA